MNSNGGTAKQDFGAAMVEDPLQFGGSQAGIEHHQNGADPHGRKVSLQRHGAVRGKDGHAIAGLHAQLQQGGRLTVHASPEFRVRETAIAVDDCGEVAPGVDAARQEIERGER